MDGARQAQLIDLLARVRSIQLSSPSGDDTTIPATHLLSEVREVLEASAAALAELEAEAYSRVEQGGAGDGAAAAMAAAASLADVCFMAVAELRSHGEKLARLDPGESGSSWSILAVAEQTLRALTRALSAAEGELALLLGVSPRSPSRGDLARRLELRRACGSFRRHVRNAERDFPDVAAFLRSAVTALVRLKGRQEFAALAFTDRLMVRHLVERTFEWARSGPDAEEGRHLRDEVLLFQELLGQINAEPEIVEHDLRQVSELLEELQEESLWGPPPISALERLRTLRGRHAELNQRIADRADVFQLLEALGELRRELDAGGTDRGETLPIPSEMPPVALAGREGWS